MNSRKTRIWLLGGFIAVGVYFLARKANRLAGLGMLSCHLASSEVSGTIKRVVNDLSIPISQAASLTNVPAWLITVIAAHEIRYKPYTTINHVVNATGPMQMTPDTLFDTYFIANRWNLITPSIESYFRQQMGHDFNRFWLLAKDRKSDKTLATNYLLKTGFNLTAGALLLRCLLHLFKTPTGTHNAWLALGYNQGPARILRLLAKQLGTTEKKLIAQVGSQLNWQLPVAANRLTDMELTHLAPGPEAKEYIPDLIGSGGYFHYSSLMGLQSYS